MQDIDNYIENHIESEDPILRELNRTTQTDLLYANMCSGHIQGSILTMLSKIVNPTNILELGTFTGYSAIALAKGLQKGGKLITIELNDELEEFAAGFFKNAGLENTINQMVGDITDIVPSIDMMFDIVFIDANKRLYSEHYDLIFDKVNHGGLIIADNTLWYGKVADETVTDDQTDSIREFNLKVKNDPRVETYLVPVRDGLTVLRKL